MINQIQPRFFFLRDLYEIRERPSKIYHWLSFLIAAILAEIPWNLCVGTLFFFGWYFPVGMVLNVSYLIRRILEERISACGSCRISVAVPDGLGGIYQYFCAVHLFLCMLPLPRALF